MHRRIYVGEVPEIEETGDPENPFQSVVDTTLESHDHHVVDHYRPNQPPGSITQRRNSTSNKKWPRIKMGKNQHFPSNIIISSRVSKFMPNLLLISFDSGPDKLKGSLLRILLV